MPGFEKKILPPHELSKRLKTFSKVVFTNGVFDILHRGHVSYLADTKERFGGVLVVALNSDASVKLLNKGDARPYNSLSDRMAMIAALESVDFVTYFEESTPYNLIELLRPNVIVKGGDYDTSKLPETELVKSWGGHAYAIKFEYDRSTTKLVEKIKSN